MREHPYSWLRFDNVQKLFGAGGVFCAGVVGVLFMRFDLTSFGLPATGAPKSFFSLLKTYVKNSFRDVIDQPETFAEMLADEFGLGARNQTAYIKRHL